MDPVLRPPVTGIGVYTGELISYLGSEKNAEIECGFYYSHLLRNHTQYLDSRVAAHRCKDAFEHGLAYREVNHSIGKWLCDWMGDPYIGRWGSRWMDLQVWSLLSIGDWRVFHGTNHWVPSLPRTVKGVLTVHDLAYLRLPHTLASSYYRQRWIERLGQSISRVECVIADSQSTAADLQEFYKVDAAKIRVIYLGVDQREISWLDPVDKPALRQRWNLPERFLLFVGSLNTRKNALNALKAFMSIEDADLGFVIVGSPDSQSDEIEAYLQQCPRKDKVRICGYLERQDLEAFYQLATAFVFPSLYEGFGLPVLEAMKRRVPVVTSNNSSLGELFHDSAVLINPLDPADIARGIQQVLGDDNYRADLIEKGERKVQMFPWHKTGQETIDVYRSLL